MKFEKIVLFIDNIIIGSRINEIDVRLKADDVNGILYVQFPKCFNDGQCEYPKRIPYEIIEDSNALEFVAMDIIGEAYTAIYTAKR